MRDGSAVAAYLDQIRNLPVPDAAAEADLIVKARSADESAKRQLVEGLLAFSVEQADQLAPDEMPLLEAIQEGNVVLVRLVEDPAVGRPRAALRDALREHFDGPRNGG